MIKDINILKNNTVKKGITFTAFATVGNAANFLLIFILSMYLSKEDFGVLSLFNTVVLIITSLISLGTLSYYSTAYFRKTRDDFVRIYNVIVIISFITFLFLGVVILFLSDWLTTALGFQTKYQIYALVLCLLQLFYTINLTVYRNEENVLKYGGISILWMLLNFLFTVFFCVSLRWGWTGRAEAQLLSAIILFGINIIILRKKNFLEFKKPQKRHYVETLKFGLPLLPHQSAGWIAQGLDRYLINFFHGAALVGTFSFAYTFSGILLMLGTAFNNVNAVYIFKNLTNNTEDVKQCLKKQVCFMSLFFLTMTFLGYLTSYFIIVFLVPKYTDSILYLFPLFLSAFFQCVYLLFVNYLFYYSKTKALMFITSSTAIIQIILSFLLTRYTALYTAYIAALVSFLVCILVIGYSHKVYPLFNFNKKLS